VHYHAGSGICFETQNYADAPNHAHFPNAVLKKGERYKQHTRYKFQKISS
jgi:aldose 1-epimerase